MDVEVFAVPGQQTAWRWALKTNANIRVGVPLGDAVSLTAVDKYGNPTEKFSPDSAGRQVVNAIADNRTAANVQASLVAVPNGFHTTLLLRLPRVGL